MTPSTLAELGAGPSTSVAGSWKTPAGETCTTNSLQKQQEDRSQIDGWWIHEKHQRSS
jgi:hypothetical protein